MRYKPEPEKRLQLLSTTDTIAGHVIRSMGGVLCEHIIAYIGILGYDDAGKYSAQVDEHLQALQERFLARVYEQQCNAAVGVRVVIAPMKEASTSQMVMPLITITGTACYVEPAQMEALSPVALRTRANTIMRALKKSCSFYTLGRYVDEMLLQQIPVDIPVLMPLLTAAPDEDAAALKDTLITYLQALQGPALTRALVDALCNSAPQSKLFDEIFTCCARPYFEYMTLAAQVLTKDQIRKYLLPIEKNARIDYEARDAERITQYIEALQAAGFKTSDGASTSSAASMFGYSSAYGGGNRDTIDTAFLEDLRQAIRETCAGEADA
nr:hypothetical protein [Maliibacterium massiliense]